MGQVIKVPIKYILIFSISTFFSSTVNKLPVYIVLGILSNQYQCIFCINKWIGIQEWKLDTLWTSFNTKYKALLVNCEPMYEGTVEHLVCVNWTFYQQQFYMTGTALSIEKSSVQKNIILALLSAAIIFLFSLLFNIQAELFSYQPWLTKVEA